MAYLAQAGYFLLLIAALVLVHEVGHFLAAKLCEVRVIRFSVGLGPRLFGVQVGETDYCLSAVPLGGYVKLLGEEPSDEVAGTERRRALHEQSFLRRSFVVLAGPACNLLLPVAIYSAVFASDRVLPAAVCASILPGLPADRVLEPGDRVIAIEGRAIRYWSELEERVSARAGRPVRLTIERDRRTLEVTLTPKAHEKRDPIPRKVGILGISPRGRAAQIGILDPEGPFAQADVRTFDVVTTVNAQPTTTHAELERQLRRIRGEPARLTLLRPELAGLGFVDFAILNPRTSMVLPAAGHELLGGLERAEPFIQRSITNSPLFTLGLREGDEILRLDGQPFGSPALFEDRLAAEPGREHNLEWRRPGERTSRQGTFRTTERSRHDEYGQRRVERIHGAVFRSIETPIAMVAIEHPLPNAISRALGRTFAIGRDMIRAVALLIATPEALGGPLLVLQIAGIAVERGWDYFLSSLALVSINIGLVNLLPIPALDGGHLLFFSIESLLGRPIPPRARRGAQLVGFAILALLVILAVRNDIMRYLVR